MGLEKRYYLYPVYKAELLNAHWMDHIAMIIFTCSLSVQCIYFSLIEDNLFVKCKSAPLNSQKCGIGTCPEIIIGTE